MNEYHCLPTSANLFTHDDVLHLLAAKLNMSCDCVLKRIIHYKRLRTKAIMSYGTLIARSDDNRLYAYVVSDNKRVANSKTFTSGTFVVIFKNGTHARIMHRRKK